MKLAKQNEIKCFLSKEADSLMHISRYMQEPEELKVKTGQIC